MARHHSLLLVTICVVALSLATAYVGPSVNVGATKYYARGCECNRAFQQPTLPTLPRRAAVLRMQESEEPAAPEDAGAITETKSSDLYQAYLKFSDTFSTLFPVWTLAVAVLALKVPSSLSWFSTNLFTAGLALLMLSMGITLTVDDFKRVAKKPVAVGLQFLQCYAMMPMVALFIGKAMALPSSFVAGLVLVGSINGGQASNLCTYIARGDVALSVLMTTATTVGAIFMTPLLCKLLLGTIVPVDAAGVAISTIQVVLFPIIAGMTFNKFFPETTKKIEPFCPVVGVVCTCLLVGSAVAQVSGPILGAGLALQAAAAGLHLVGGLVAYFSFKALRYSETLCRTTCIETSMKSSAFGFLLAKLHFGEFLVRVPAAVSVVWMALIGSSLAVAFRFLPAPKDDEPEPVAA